MSRTASRFVVLTRNAAVFAVITAVVFVLVEGLTGTAIAVYQTLRGPPKPGTSRFDSSIGWVGIPNTYVRDMYGPGIYVRTNARGFRDDDETEASEPKGKLRIICSGDSFTYGVGVANDRTWCHRISELDGRFQTVNMGQPGYGVDQMFLWYSRDGVELAHSIHIFAFIGGDLERMASRSQRGYGKPVLELDEGELVTANAPVPRLRWSVTRAVTRAELRSVDFAQRLLARLFPRNADGSTVIERVGPVAAEVFQSVQRLSTETSAVPLFVFLPNEQDVADDSAWRRWVGATMDTLGLRFVDLTPDLRSVPAGRAGTFFFPRWMPQVGHYTDAGNEWVAEVLYNHLMEMPEVQALLTEASSAPVANGE